MFIFSSDAVYTTFLSVFGHSVSYPQTQNLIAQFLTITTMLTVN